ncbi:hypothetical protein ACP70R_001205 [Stipagrostis hirtigluma subsp. patula]
MASPVDPPSLDSEFALRIAFCIPTYLSKPDNEPPRWIKRRTLNVVVDTRTYRMDELTEYVGNAVRWGSKQLVTLFFKVTENSRCQPLVTNDDLVKAFSMCTAEKFLYIAVKIEDFHGPLCAIPSPEKRKKQSRRGKTATADASPTEDVASDGVPCTPPTADTSAPVDSQSQPSQPTTDSTSDNQNQPSQPTTDSADGVEPNDEGHESEADSMEVQSDRSCYSSGESSDSDYEPDEGDDEIGDDKSDFTEFSFDYGNPCIDKGTLFPDAETFRKILRHHAIINDYQYAIDKSDLDRVRVHCADPDCQWRIHASKTRDKRYFKVKINDAGHTCSSVNKCDDRLASAGWVADRVLEWLKEKPNLGPKALQEKINEHYHIEVKYSRVFAGKEMALDRIFGNYAQSYPLLYAFKEELIRKIPGSIVEIDTESVNEKICFRCTNEIAAINFKDSKGNVAREVVDVKERACSCGKWQLTGLPCLHGIAFIASFRKYKMEAYVHEFYSIERFKKAYEGILYPLTDKSKWPTVDPGFILRPPLVRRQPGRPRSERIKGSEEPGAKRRHKCSRCGGLGHHSNRCTRGPASEQGSNNPAAQRPTKRPRSSSSGSSRSCRTIYWSVLKEQNQQDLSTAGGSRTAGCSIHVKTNITKPVAKPEPVIRPVAKT